MTDLEFQELFNKNTNLVHYIINKYFSSEDSIDYDDMTQEGFIGLWKAVKTYDESKGIKFSTYAGRCIYNNIGMVRRSINKKYKYNIQIESLDNVLNVLNAEDSEIEFHEMIEDSHSLDDFEMIELYDCIDKVCNDFEKSCVILKASGYSIKDICKVFGYSRTSIQRVFYIIYSKLYPMMYGVYDNKYEKLINRSVNIDHIKNSYPVSHMINVRNNKDDKYE